MATLELDPLFVKALKLLHSKAKDSAEQLKQLLDDTLQQQTQGPAEKQQVKDVDSAVSLNPLAKRLSPKVSQDIIQGNSRKTVIKDDDSKRKESDRRFDKLRLESSESVVEAKRIRIDSPKPSRSPSPAVKEDLEKDDEETMDASRIVVEMGLVCVVCRSFDVSPGNRLGECQDCKSLYHQECHKPPITDQVVNDPRLVWYCAKCTKNNKKIASKSIKVVKPTVNIQPKENPPALKPVKPEPPLLPQIFKREPKATSSTGTTTPPNAGNKPIGLAALAASLSGKPHTSSKSGHSSGKSSTVKSTSPVTVSSKSIPSSMPSQAGELKIGPFAVLGASSRSSSSGTGSNNGNGISSSGATSGGNGSSSSNTGSGSLQPFKSSSASTSLKISSGSSGSGNSNNSSSASSSSSKSSTSSSLMSADKRLQIMKKKAAAKHKRKLSSK